MMRLRWLWLLVIIAVAVGLWLLVDHLWTSDAERIEIRVKEATAAVETSNVGALNEMFSAECPLKKRDPAGFVEAIRSKLEFVNLNSVTINSIDDPVFAPDKKKATVTGYFAAETAGVAVLGAGQGTYTVRVDLEMVKDPDGQWRFMNATASTPFPGGQNNKIDTFGQ